jgi:thiamine-phosphate pyrophosphorylase
MERPDAEILWRIASDLAREAAKVSRPGSPGPRSLPPLLFFTDPDRTPRPWETALRLPAGAGVVFRHFGASDALETARRLREATRARQVLLLIGLDVGLAEAVDADGVHLPERALEQAAGLRAAHPAWRLTGAAHSAEALSRAALLDAAVLSPVFEAGGASAGRPALGRERFVALVRTAPCPVYALGGLDAKTAPELVGSGACGLAGVSAIADAFASA